MKIFLLLATSFALATAANTRNTTRSRSSRGLFSGKAKTGLLSLPSVAATANAGVGARSLSGGIGFGGHSISGGIGVGGRGISGGVGLGGHGISGSVGLGGHDISGGIGLGGHGISGNVGVGGHGISGGVGVGGDNARFSVQTFQEPQYIRNQIKKLTPVTLEKLIEEEWGAFKLTYNKAYPSAEIEAFRKEVFIENREKIAKFNQEYSKGKVNYVQQLNPFGDLLSHEFNKLVNGFNRSNLPTPKLPTPTTFIPSANVNIPPSVDWRQVGAVTPVKSQGLCASCYAFAAAGALEGHWFRKTGELVDISEQNFVDCTKSYGNDGCMGGLIDPSFEYVRQNGGIDGEASYPYEEKDDQQCRFKPENVVAQCTGYVDLAEADEKGLELAVATLGPIAVAIDASRDGLQFYSDGVYYDPECGNTLDDMNHAVLIVGYGQEPNGQKYWLVKNSYGAQWGLGGYIKMAKDVNNHCGIANTPSYPLV